MRRKSPLVFNTTAVADPVTNVFESVTINLLPTGCRYDTFEGRPYKVVPMVMITEGVHNGSHGPVLYPGQELGKTPESWNHKPIVVYHPTFNGQGVSACDPTILEKQGIGLVFGARYEGMKLHAEAWLNEEKTKAVDERILTALENNQMVELSTGLFLDNDGVEGEWEGQKYVGTVANYRPDHLAILPDKIGACSIADGAGLLRLNEASHDDTRRRIMDKLRSTFTQDVDLWMEDVFQSFFVYHADGKLFKQGYTSTDVGVNLVGSPVEVVRVTEFHTLDGTFVGNIMKESSSVDKKKFVDDLISNTATQWEESDRSFLMELKEPTLKKFKTPVANEKPKEDEKVLQNEKKKEEEKKVTINKEEKPKEEKPVTLEGYVSNAPKDIQELLTSGLQAVARDKVRLISGIMANERNPFSEDELKAKNLKDLTALHALAGPLPSVNRQPDFSGLGEAFHTPGVDLSANSSQAVVEPLVAPVLNFLPTSN